MRDVIGCRLVRPQRQPQRIERHIEANLAAIAEAIDHGLRDGENLHLHAVDGHRLDGRSQRRVAEVHEAHRQMRHLRLVVIFADGHPDAARGLQRDLMVLQRGNQADDALRYPHGDLW